MAVPPRKLSGRTPVEIRRNLRLGQQATLVACRLKLAVLRGCFDGLPGERAWPVIADLPESVARGYATDAEVARLMALVACGDERRIGDLPWRRWAAELYTLEVPALVRTSA
jgi:uncharacterized protein (DUF2267 family)